MYGSTSTTYNDQIYNQRSVDNSYRSSTELSSPQASTTYNQTTIETTPADRTLIQQVQLAIRNDTALVSVAPMIQISAQGGTVTLNGNVQNENQKQAVERAAKGTTGVVTVNHQLQVSSDANQSSQIQPGTSQTGGSQSRLYQNSSRQSQGSISGGVGASSSGSFGASTDLNGAGTNNAEQASAFGKDSSSGATSDKYGSSNGKRLYSTKDDLATNSLNSAQGASGESSLGSTNAASGSASSSSDNSLNSGSSTSQKNSDASVSGAVSDTNSLNSSSSQGETKNLSPTSKSQEPRLYSTNQNDQATNGSFSANSSTSVSSDSLSLSVQGATESDQKLADQVRQELSSNSAVSGGMSRLRISLENGKATIRGTVKSDQEKQDIEKSIQKVTGVTSVQNELRVSSNSGQSGTDESK
jgi:osmotically-inducible protein OsmY